MVAVPAPPLLQDLLVFFPLVACHGNLEEYESEEPLDGRVSWLASLLLGLLGQRRSHAPVSVLEAAAAAASVAAAAAEVVAAATEVAAAAAEDAAASAVATAVAAVAAAAAVETEPADVSAAAGQVGPVDAVQGLAAREEVPTEGRLCQVMALEQVLVGWNPVLPTLDPNPAARRLRKE